MKTLVNNILFVICFLVLPFTQPYAATALTGPAGGGGGNPFSDAMGNLEDLRVKHVTVNHGSFIDAIQVFYVDKNGTPVNGTKHGGGGGTPTTLTLDDDEVITRVSAKYGDFIDSLTIETNKGQSQTFGGAGGHSTFEYNAPIGSRIMGFWGRAGSFVDALGVIIAPFADLLNISYNGPVASTGIKPAMIVAAKGTFVITAESYPGAIPAMPNPSINLITLGGTPVASNDDCNVLNIADYIGRPLTTAYDACLVLSLSPGAYVVEVSDADGGDGNVLFGATESLRLP